MPPSVAFAPGSTGKEQSGVAQVGVERFARDAGLHDAIGVVGVDGQHLVHARQVDADAAVRRADVTFERRARAVRDHRNAQLVDTSARSC